MTTILPTRITLDEAPSSTRPSGAPTRVAFPPIVVRATIGGVAVTLTRTATGDLFGTTTYQGVDQLWDIHSLDTLQARELAAHARALHTTGPDFRGATVAAHIHGIAVNDAVGTGS